MIAEKNIAQIHDKSGKMHDAYVGYSKGTVISVCSLPFYQPIDSVTILSTGEMQNRIRDSKFNGNKELAKLWFGRVKSGILNGIIPVSSGFLYGFIHPDNKPAMDEVKYLGFHIENIMRNGESLVRFYLSIDEIIMSVVK